MVQKIKMENEFFSQNPTQPIIQHIFYFYFEFSSKMSDINNGLNIYQDKFSHLL